MKIEIIKSESGKFCLHPLCKKNSQYVSPKGRIKKNTIAVKISHPIIKKNHVYEVSYYYCRSCIDLLLLNCRTNLDSKLWVFA